MHKFLPRVFLFFALLFLGWAAAQAQVVYGVEFNKPLTFPKCKKSQAHVPKVACYVQRERTRMALGIVRSVRVYFPKNKAPAGSINNAVDLDLLDDQVVEMRVSTTGLKGQAKVVEMLTARFGKAMQQWVVQTDDEPDLNRDAIFARWEVQGLVVRLFGSVRGENGQGALYLTDSAYKQRMDLLGDEAFVGMTPMSGVEKMNFYGIGLNKPLGLPQCKERGAHVPQGGCYVEKKKRVMNYGTVTDGLVFFPENRAPEGSRKNYVHVMLLNNKVVQIFFYTKGGANQGAMFVLLKEQLGEPVVHDVKQEDYRSAEQSVVVGMWRADGVIAQFMGMTKKGEGFVSLTAQELVQAKVKADEKDWSDKVVKLGSAGSNTVYSIAWNRPLTFPMCQESGLKSLEEVCYTDLNQKTTNLGTVRNVRVYFPKHLVLLGPSDQYLYVNLLNEKVVEVFFMTNGLIDQEAVFEMLMERFGKPLVLEIQNKAQGAFAKDAILAIWQVDGLVVQLIGSATKNGGGLVSLVTQEFADANERNGEGNDSDKTVEQGGAGSPVMYGLAFNQPLTLPRCRVTKDSVDGRYFPQRVCYLVESPRENGADQSVVVYFPEGQVPKGFASNELYVRLRHNKVWAMQVFTKGDEGMQKFIFLDLTKIFGPADDFSIEADSTSRLRVGALKAYWKQVNGLNISFWGSFKSDGLGLMTLELSSLAD